MHKQRKVRAVAFMLALLLVIQNSGIAYAAETTVEITVGDNLNNENSVSDNGTEETVSENFVTEEQNEPEVTEMEMVA